VEVTINGESDRAGPGSSFFGSNDEHGLKNVGAPATYHVIRMRGGDPRIERSRRRHQRGARLAQLHPDADLRVGSAGLKPSRQMRGTRSVQDAGIAAVFRERTECG
jgi:hypothetical protein